MAKGRKRVQVWCGIVFILVAHRCAGLTLEERMRVGKIDPACSRHSTISRTAGVLTYPAPGPAAGESLCLWDVVPPLQMGVSVEVLELRSAANAFLRISDGNRLVGNLSGSETGSWKLSSSHYVRVTFDNALRERDTYFRARFTFFSKLAPPAARPLPLPRDSSGRKPQNDESPSQISTSDRTTATTPTVTTPTVTTPTVTTPTLTTQTKTTPTETAPAESDRKACSANGIRLTKAGMLVFPISRHFRLQQSGTCFWIITVPPGKKVEISLLSIKLTGDDTFLIYGDSGPLLKLPGPSVRKLVVESSEVYMVYQSESENPPNLLIARQFLDRVTTTAVPPTEMTILTTKTPIFMNTENPAACPDEKNQVKVDGPIKYPAFGQYPNNVACTWNIYPPNGLSTELSLLHLDTEENFDVVKVYDDKVLRRQFSGQQRAEGAEVVVLISRRPKIVFESDSSKTGNGFRIQIDFIVAPTTRQPDVFGPTMPSFAPSHYSRCRSDGVEINSDTLLRYPGNKETYEDNLHCVWIFRPRSNQDVGLTVLFVDIEEQHDSLSVRDGSKIFQPVSGSFTSGYVRLRADSPRLRFLSDGSIGGRGFVINATFIAAAPGEPQPPPPPADRPLMTSTPNFFWTIASTLRVPTTFPPVDASRRVPITPPVPTSECARHTDVIAEGRLEYPSAGHYAPYSECVWTVHRPLQTIVEIRVEKLSVEASHYCLFDALQIFNGNDDASNRVAALCGSTFTRSAIKLTARRPTIRFMSDGDVNQMGFAINIRFVQMTNFADRAYTPQTTFENSFGDEWNAASSGELRWQRLLPSDVAKLFVDRSGSERGRFAGVIARRPRIGERTSGDLVSQIRPSKYGYCLVFYHHVANSFVTLQVLLRSTASGLEKVKWQRDGHGQGHSALPPDLWTRAEVAVSSESDFQVVFRAVATNRSAHVLNYTAIDDVSIVRRSCSYQALPKRDCGMSSSMSSSTPAAEHVGRSGRHKIYGGEASSPHQWPWMVRVAYHLSPSDHLECSGSLINSRWVMTAEHCVSPRGQIYNYEISFGEHDARQFDRGQFELTPSRIFTPKQQQQYFNSSGERDALYSVDIALFELPYELDFTALVYPVCLSTPEVVLPDVVKLMGWGMDPDNEASKLLRHVDLNLTPCGPVPQAKSTELCTFSPDRDVCSGDSGGPAVVWQHGRWLQVGVVSRGPPCPSNTNPSIHADVRAARFWIDRIIRRAADPRAA